VFNIIMVKIKTITDLIKKSKSPALFRSRDEAREIESYYFISVINS